MRVEDFTPGEITPQELTDGDCFKVNHRGDSKWIYPLLGFVSKLCRWVESKKKFRAIIDYNPEWCFKVTFRSMTDEEAATMDSYRPTADERDNLRARLNK